QG
ncbi:hypothetical protein CP03DC29_0592B, partial [Chlamydia psittaci 03DC29]